MECLVLAAGPAELSASFLWPMVVSLSVTLLVCPAVRRAAILLALYDRPDGGLKPHQRPIPYLGGVAMYVGWIAALLTACFLGPGARAYVPYVAVGGSVLMLTGLIDDIKHLSPKFRLFIQALMAGVLMYGGIGRHTSRALLEPLAGVLPAAALSEPAVLAVSAGVCIFTLAGASNATNFIDGLDGLCGGILAIAMLGFAALSVLVNHNDPGHDPSGVIRLVVCGGIFGACLGFLFYNFNPASIFMGDSGSLLLGFNVAVLMLLLAEQPCHAGYATWRWLDCGLMVFAFPVLDTGVAITRRWLNRRPLFRGDRSHLYDQIRDRGLSVRQTVLVCYSIGVLFGLIALAVSQLPVLLFFGVLLGIPSLAGILCRRFGLLRVDDTAARSGH
ncbi:MAG: hypothetical protein DCC65_18220 [Planctomycetota bacterium]|nr:MAG: hypothetical protein DCC65_18220 [Planctomycetota bacterium]